MRIDGVTVNDEIWALAEKIKATSDPERDHGEADDVLIECIRSLAQLVDILQDGRGADVMKPTELLISRFNALPRWYA